MKPQDDGRRGSLSQWLAAIGIGGLLLLMVVTWWGWMPRAAIHDAAPKPLQAPEEIQIDRPEILEDAVRMVAIPVDGMVCAVCAANVRRNLDGMDGVEAVNVILAERRAVVRYEAGKISPEAMIERLRDRTGFRIGEPHVIED